ncbi:hypothetical protein [Rhizobium sp. X9]|uniref:hypothetical protein n=1 Tax=Rhizobium sp. X9 TaxID=2815360 RepID=UPI001C0DBE22|nr:hypothetical protein [Rhizobium sp. X9]
MTERTYTAAGRCQPPAPQVNTLRKSPSSNLLLRYKVTYTWFYLLVKPMFCDAVPNWRTHRRHRAETKNKKEDIIYIKYNYIND